MLVISVWAVWGYKYWLSRQYRPLQGHFQGTVSIVIPTFRESFPRLEEAIATARLQRPLEVIVAVDKREPETKARVRERFGDGVPVGAERREAFWRSPQRSLGGILARFSSDQAQTPVRIIDAPPGKRKAVAEAVKAARGEIVMVTASDVRLEPGSVRNLVAAFADPRVGGACGYTRAIMKQGSLASLIFFWIIEMRAKLTYRALGARRQVHVLDGECFAVRREYWLGVIDRYVDQRFMGIRPVSGDDGWITSLLLEDGWQTVYQENARVHTYAPATVGELMTQQLRWARNSVRRSWYVLSRGVAFRTGLPYTVHILTNLLRTPVFSVLVVVALASLFGGWRMGGANVDRTELWTIPFTEVALFSGGIGVVAAAVTGMTVTRAIRSLPRFQRGRMLIDLLLLPAYSVIGLMILMPLRLYGTLTARRTTWGTRGGGSITTPGGMISLAGTVVALAAALSVPAGIVIILGSLALSLVAPTEAVTPPAAYPG